MAQQLCYEFIVIASLEFLWKQNNISVELNCSENIVSKMVARARVYHHLGTHNVIKEHGLAAYLEHTDKAAISSLTLYMAS